MFSIPFELQGYRQASGTGSLYPNYELPDMAIESFPSLEGVFIQEEFPTQAGIECIKIFFILLFCLIGRPGHISSIIMVTKDGEDPIRSFHPGDDLFEGKRIEGSIIDHITGKEDDIRVLGIDQVHRFAEFMLAEPASGMNIRELNDFQPIK